MRWERVMVNPIEVLEGGVTSGPGRRWGHSCEAMKGGTLLYVFGGYDGHLGCPTNQVHVFDTVKQTWSQPLIKGTPPAPRDNHTFTAVGDNLFVFGGTDGWNLFNDLHILNTSSLTWIFPITKGNGPKAREGHGAACVGRQLFIFGGSGKSAENNNDVYYNDLFILNAETFEWHCVAAFGPPPSPRDGHTCSFWKDQFIVIGGQDGLDTYSWWKLNTSGQVLPPRAGHSTVAFGKNLFVFGGYADHRLYDDLYMVDVATGVWTKVEATGVPSPRFSSAAGSLDTCEGGVLVLIGGCNNRLEALDDMYYLHTGLASESERRPGKLPLRNKLRQRWKEKTLIPPQKRGVLNIPVPQPTGERLFEAKIAYRNSAGFAVHTVIDRKPFHGFVLESEPISLQSASQTRKRTADETGIVNELKTSKALKMDERENRQEDSGHGEGSVSHEHCSEAVAAPIASNQMTSEPHKVSANPEPQVTTDNQTNDSQLSSNYEVPRHA